MEQVSWDSSILVAEAESEHPGIVTVGFPMVTFGSRVVRSF